MPKKQPRKKRGRPTHPPPQSLGKTTGWIHRLAVRKAGVQQISGVEYVKVDDEGLHLDVAEPPKDKRPNKAKDAAKNAKRTRQVLDIDTVVVCAGQESNNGLTDPLRAAGIHTFEIGGADLASELDAKRAIDQGVRLASKIEDAQPTDTFLAPIPLTKQVFDKLYPLFR